MSSFADLKFEPHPDAPEGGIIAKKDLGNGYGVIVERIFVTDERGAILQYTLGAEEGLYQIGFTKDGEPFFEDPLPSNYIGAASEEVVTKFMQKIENIVPIVVFTDDDELDDGLDNENEVNLIDYRHGDTADSGGTVIKGTSINAIEL